MMQFLIAAPRSGSGKTTMTCAVLAALKKRGADPCAFKSGPDYIDPMFHRSALQVDSHNLDLFLSDRPTVQALYARCAAGHGAAVCEGAMGFYDGQGLTTRASAWELADTLGLPVLLVVQRGGASVTLAAEIQGLMHFRKNSHISGILLNSCSEKLYKMLKSEPYGLRDGYIPILIAYVLRAYQNVSLYFHGNEHSYTQEELVKALSEPENYTLFVCNWNEEEMAYIESLEEIFKIYLPKGDSLNRLEDLFKAVNTHYSSISKSARTTEVYVSDIAKKYRNIMSLSYKDYNKFFFDVLPELNSNLQELIIQIRSIKKELESVNEKQYIRVVRATKQVFEISEDEDMMSAIETLYQESWKEKSQKAFDYTTNGVLDIVSKVSNLSEKNFIEELARAVTGFELNYWTDNKINDFEETLRTAVNRLDAYDPTEGLQQGEMKITIESGDGNPIISQFSQNELTTAGQTMLNKMKNTIGSFGGSLSYEEKISIMAQLLKDVIN